MDTKWATRCSQSSHGSCPCKTKCAQFSSCFLFRAFSLINSWYFLIWNYLGWPMCSRFFDLNIFKIFQDEIWSGSKEASQQLPRPGNGSTFSYDIDNFREKSFEVPLQQVLRKDTWSGGDKKGHRASGCLEIDKVSECSGWYWLMMNDDFFGDCFRASLFLWLCSYHLHFFSRCFSVKIEKDESWNHRSELENAFVTWTWADRVKQVKEAMKRQLCELARDRNEQGIQGTCYTILRRCPRRTLNDSHAKGNYNSTC